jgi:hypothetical protein
VFTSSVTPRRVEKIFRTITRRKFNAQAHRVSARSGGIGILNDRKERFDELDETEFIEALLRIAHCRLPGPRERKLLLKELRRDKRDELMKGKQHGHVRRRSVREVIRLSMGLDPAHDHRYQNEEHLRAFDESNTSSGSSKSAAQPPPGGEAESEVTVTEAEIDAALEDEWGLPLDATNTRFGLALRFYSLIRLHVIPHALRLRTDSFRSAYKQLSVSKVFRRSWSNTINYSEYLQFLKECRLVDSAGLTLELVYAIFANVQHDFHAGSNVSIDVVVKRNFASDNKPTKRAAAPADEAAATADARATEESEAKARLQSPSRRPRTVKRFGKHRSRSTGKRDDDADAPAAPQADDETRQDDASEAKDAAQTQPAKSSDGGLSPSGGSGALVTEASTESLPTRDHAAYSSNEELIYVEFLEALAAIAAVRFPDPFLNLSVKIQKFLETDLLPFIAKLPQPPDGQDDDCPMEP